ncbi:hypothetical protein V2H45_11645 [Tumidithrix elongata RA019]|uniref:Uncharacterized protein n=1 Tax=Tumidithrix elongata BACA0141 TaxID=2716417 RepID=A0AAW9Q2E6_9CYAN|nr:hypothetical protein [Tumidithrix elongata RA019]
MSTTQVRNLIEEINNLLSRPIGSVSRGLSPETLQQREQLKHLRSQLESATEDQDLSELERECNQLISQIKGEVQPLQVQPLQIDTLRLSRLDKLDIRQKLSERVPGRRDASPLGEAAIFPISQPSFLRNNSDLIKEGSIMANDTPESNLPSMNEQIVAIVQHTIQQTIQQAVQQSVQQSVEQSLKQALTVERAVIVNEISANLKSFVDTQLDIQQRSQANEELQILDRKKQDLRQEIAKLEADRQAWMAQFAQIQRSQQEALAQSLQETLHETVTQTVSQSLNPLLTSLNQELVPDPDESESASPDLSSPEFVQQVQQQTDRFLLNLDAMFNATFRSLEQNIHSYKATITEQLDQMQTLEQQGKSLIDSLIEHVSEHASEHTNAVNQAHASEIPPSVEPTPVASAIADLPSDIDPRYFNTTPESIDEALVSTLLAGGDATSLYPEVVLQEMYNAGMEVLPSNPILQNVVPEEASKFADRLQEAQLRAHDLEPVIVEDYSDAEIQVIDPDFDPNAVTQPFDLIGLTDSVTAQHLSDSEIEASLEIPPQAREEQAQEEIVFASASLSEQDLFSQEPSGDLPPSNEHPNEDPALLEWLDSRPESQLPPKPLANDDDETDLTAWLNHKSITFSASTRADDAKKLGRPNDTDNAESSDESLILLPDAPARTPDVSQWINDSLIQDLAADLENLESGKGFSPAIASNLNQVIRNTPFAAISSGVIEPPRQPVIQLSQSSPIEPSSNALESSIEQDLEYLEIPQIVENPEDLYVDSLETDDCILQESTDSSEALIHELLQPEPLPLNPEVEANPFISPPISQDSSELSPFDSSTLSAPESRFTESSSPEAANLIDDHTSDVSPFSIGDRDDSAALFVEETPSHAETQITPAPIEASAPHPPDDAESIFAEVLASQSQGKTSINTVTDESEDEIDALFLGLPGISGHESSSKPVSGVITSAAKKIFNDTLEAKNSAAASSDSKPSTPIQSALETEVNPSSDASEPVASADLSSDLSLGLDREFEKVMNELENDINRGLDAGHSSEIKDKIEVESSQANPLESESDASDSSASLAIDEFDELALMIQSQSNPIDSLTSEPKTVEDILSISEEFETVLQTLAFEQLSDQSEEASSEEVQITDSSADEPPLSLSLDDLDGLGIDGLGIDGLGDDLGIDSLDSLGNDLEAPSSPALVDRSEANPLVDLKTDSEEDDFTHFLDDLEAGLPYPSFPKQSSTDAVKDSLASNLTTQTISSPEEELSAEDFFASLGDDDSSDSFDSALNEFADSVDSDMPDSDFLKTLEEELLNSDYDLQLTNFADFDDGAEQLDNSSWEQFVEKATTSSGLAISDNSDDNLDTVLFSLDAIDFQFENQPDLLAKLDFKTDERPMEERTLDVESQVIESERVVPIPPEPPEPPYSINDTWFLGVDFGSVYMRASLVNANTGRVYPLTLTKEGENLSTQILLNTDLSDARSTDDALKQSPTVNIAISHFKSFLKLGLPYRGISAWQPILQWSHTQQITLKWLMTALQNFLGKIQTEATHAKLTDASEILQNLSGVILGHPPEWSDTYVLNLREAVLNAGLVNQAEQIMVIDQAIAPVLSFLHQNQSLQQITLAIDAGAVTTSLCLIKALGDPINRSHIYSRSIDYAGLGINQDIVTQLLYPHWQIVTNPARESCNLEHLTLPDPSDPAPAQRALLQQTLLSSPIGQQLLEFAEQIKLDLFSHPDRVQWSRELEGQPLTVQRREVESQVLQPFIQRLNRELNLLLSIAGMTGEDVAEVWQLGGTMAFPSLSRWLVQKLPFANMTTLPSSTVANGLAIAPLFPQLLDISRQQYSDYFLLQEICRLNLKESLTPKSLLQQLQNRGINIKVCRDRILTLLQGDIPNGLFPWLEPEKELVLSDPTLVNELFTGRLFELETDGSYKPNVLKFQQLSNYLHAILCTMRQTLNEPLVFPDFKIAVQS